MSLITPLLGSVLGLEGVGEVPTRHPDKQTDLLLYKHIAQVTSSSFSRLFSDKMQKDPQQCLHWHSNAGPGPPLGFPNEKSNKHHKPSRSGEVPPIAGSCHVSSCCEKTSAIPNLCPEGHQTRLKYTKTKQRGITAWVHDFYKYHRSTHPLLLIQQDSWALQYDVKALSCFCLQNSGTAKWTNPTELSRNRFSKQLLSAVFRNGWQLFPFP